MTGRTYRAAPACDGVHACSKRTNSVIASTCWSASTCLRHRHALRGAIEASRVLFRTEQIQMSVRAAVCLGAVEDHLPRMKNLGRGIPFDRAIRSDFRIVPSVLRRKLLSEHAAREVTAKAKILRQSNRGFGERNNSNRQLHSRVFTKRRGQFRRKCSARPQDSTETLSGSSDAIPGHFAQVGVAYPRRIRGGATVVGASWCPSRCSKKKFFSRAFCTTYES